jgi:hypothetical protein
VTIADFSGMFGTPEVFQLVGSAPIVFAEVREIGWRGPTTSYASRGQRLNRPVTGLGHLRRQNNPAKKPITERTANVAKVISAPVVVWPVLLANECIISGSFCINLFFSRCDCRTPNDPHMAMRAP